MLFSQMSSRGIDFLNGDEKFADFFLDYLCENKPCLISSKLTNNWRAVQDWCINGKINVDFLKEDFGNASVPVVSCGAEYGHATCSQMTLAEYLGYLKTKAPTENPEKGLYLKDWHFQSQFPGYNAYTVPVYFASDWLNEYCDMKQDSVERDYRFVYIGKAGTWTAFHADVFRSHSWSTNVCGRKLWYLVPPGSSEDILRYLVEGNYHSDIRRLFKSGQLPPDAVVIDVIQEQGETILVPSGWHHQVHNLEDTVSINHNWINSSNIAKMRDYVKSRLDEVSKEILHLKADNPDWNSDCQKILKADVGIDYEEFVVMLCKLLKNRLQKLSTEEKDEFCCCTSNAEVGGDEFCSVLKTHWRENCDCDSPWQLCSSCTRHLLRCDIFILKTELKQFITLTEMHYNMDENLLRVLK